VLCWERNPESVKLSIVEESACKLFNDRCNAECSGKNYCLDCADSDDRSCADY
jgi:hypothetical protein